MTDVVPVNAEDVETAEEAAARVADAIDQQIRQTVRQMKGMWVDLASSLHRFARGELWRDIGFDSFEEYLDQPDLELGRRWTFELIAMYEQLVIQREVRHEQLRQLNSSKVREVLPAIRRGAVTLEEGLSDAGVLSRHDLEVRYRGLASATPGQPDVDSVIRTEREPVSRVGVAASEPAPAPTPAPLPPTERSTVVCPHCGGSGRIGT